MANLDAEVRGLAQEIQKDILADYKKRRDTMSGAEKQTALAELASFNRTVEGSSSGAAYPFFSPTAIVANNGMGDLARAQAAVTP